MIEPANMEIHTSTTRTVIFPRGTKPSRGWVKTSDPFVSDSNDRTTFLHDVGIWPIGSMYGLYGNIYHPYTPVMLAYIPAPWILWVIGQGLNFMDFSDPGPEEVASDM